MKVDYDKLDEGLKNLRGLDFEAVEQRMYRADKIYANITFSKEFQARLAAAALSVPYEDITELPLKEYTAVTQRGFAFLYSTSDDETLAENSEA